MAVIEEYPKFIADDNPLNKNAATFPTPARIFAAILNALKFLRTKS